MEKNDSVKKKMLPAGLLNQMNKSQANKSVYSFVTFEGNYELIFFMNILTKKT